MRQLRTAFLILMLLPFSAVEANAPQTKGDASLSKPWYGMASWYGSQWDGKKTACGQVYDSKRLYAAHPSLTCGTWLRVTNMRTKQWEFVKIVDRGPYVEGREMDVSERVAVKIGIKKWGTEYVKLEIVRSAK